RFRNNQRAAALRAFTAASLFASGSAPSVAAAAVCCGSCPPYLGGAGTALPSQNKTIIKEMLSGAMGLSRAAAQVRRVADLVSAYRRAADKDRVSFARAGNAEQLLDVLAQASA